jgi:acyl dehydratase
MRGVGVITAGKTLASTREEDGMVTAAWDEIEVGQEVPMFVDPPFTFTDFVRYQGASGDANPSYHDVLFAQKAGYLEPFAIGMRQAGVVVTYGTDWFGPANVRSLGVQFCEQAWQRDIISYSGRVTDKGEVGGEPPVDAEFTANRQPGGVRLRGWTTFAAPSVC